MRRSMRTSKASSSRNKKAQAGMAMVETLIAIGILLVAATGVMGLATVALTTTENQGHLSARTAEYAQDKMEQLMALAFCDGGTDGKSGTDTTVFPSVAGTGSGLAGCSSMASPVIAQAGGGLDTTAPTTTPAPFVDYLDANGNKVASTANWQYIRVWQITVISNTLKQIAVKVQAKNPVGGNNATGLAPQSTVVALKQYLL